MCGIVGILEREGGPAPPEGVLRQMLAMIRHRGPDQFGIYVDERTGLGSARLSIIDLSAGQQPISNEDGTLWIVFNGEIFNYPELRRELQGRGHRFSTQTDTEVALHLYEDLGPECLQRFNGQFAMAIWNAREHTLFLARDRLGVRPLFYAEVEGSLLFGSEIKSLLATGRIGAHIDPVSLDQVFTFWSLLASRTMFQGIVELPPGCFLIAGQGRVSVRRYWQLEFPESQIDSSRIAGPEDLDARVEEFRELLVDAARIRLRADVPVGAYLSGGLDSSVIAAIVRNCTQTSLTTFSIAFDDSRFDESEFQLRMARHLGTEHQVVRASHADIGRVFPEVVWHAETPLMRTAPAPMFMLSKLVRDAGFKVVLTGEGADEFLGGYDIFKESKIRRFWARNPESKWRGRLLGRLYRDVARLGQGSGAFLTAFFRAGLTDLESPWYSHSIRWRNNRRACRFFSNEVLATTRSHVNDLYRQVGVPSGFPKWDPMARAQYLEVAVFLSQYLLSSQGDRVAMAHSVEGRYPFLDRRVVEYCSKLAPPFKLRGLTDKFLLRQVARNWLPEEIWRRPKRPYRAPIHSCFFNSATPDYVRDLLSPGSIGEFGLFSSVAVGQLVRRIDQRGTMGETDDMALAGIISTQLLCMQYVKGFQKAPPIGPNDDVKVCRRPPVALAPNG